MLIEFWSPVLKSHGKPRDHIKLHKGLNVINGQSGAKNSIGKTTALVIIDFIFGGETYLDTDVVSNVGDHYIAFTFEFDGKRYSFRRSTDEPNTYVQFETDENNVVAELSKEDFLDFLSKNYGLPTQDFSFRESVGGLFRIYSKDNTNAVSPLRQHPGQNNENSLKGLVKNFREFQKIKRLADIKDEADKLLTTLRTGRSIGLLPNMVTNQTTCEEAREKIRLLQNQIEELNQEQGEVPTDSEIQEYDRRDQLERRIRELSAKQKHLENRMRLLESSQDMGFYPKEADINALMDFFPEANYRKLLEIENFHKKLASILEEEFNSERKNVVASLEAINTLIETNRNELSNIRVTHVYATDFIQEIVRLSKEKDEYENQIKTWQDHEAAALKKSRAVHEYESALIDTLSEIQNKLNIAMRAITDGVAGRQFTSPTLDVTGYRSYKFHTPKDRGTGTNYRGVIIYDLALLQLTAIPALAHDLVMFQSIEDDQIENIFKIYTQFEKQIFVAFDNEKNFTDELKRIIHDNTVLSLSKGGNELYGYAWNTVSDYVEIHE